MAKQAEGDKQLFKKIILSFFPKNEFMWEMNPTGMFVSFISTKQFFSLVNRKIVENFRLNLFDIALDPFEVKIGFGDTPGIRIKDIDAYYGYCSAANLNGYRFFSPWVMATIITLIMSLYAKDSFNKQNETYFIHFLFTVYLLSFVFSARLKKFPHKDNKANYKRFIDVFFNFFEVIFKKTHASFKSQTLLEIKKKLLKEPHIFFCLFYFYKQLNWLFDDSMNDEVYTWLFYDELKKRGSKSIIEDFIKNSKQYSSSVQFTASEQYIFDKILPADILLRYLFLPWDELLVANHVVTKIFDKNRLDEFMYSFLESDKQWEEFVLYISNFKYIKESFFDGAQAFIRHKFRLHENYDHSAEEEINDFISSVWDNDSLEWVKIPEKLRKESDAMEKLINFYVTFLWGLWISRWDSFYIRQLRPGILTDLLNPELLIWEKEDNLYYFGWLLYSYSKNIFYYKYAFDNIRAGKDKFMLPYKAKFKEVYSNMFIVKMLDENFIATLLQDINPDDIKIYVKSSQMLDNFKKKYSKKISSFVNSDRSKVIKSSYWKLQSIVGNDMDYIKVLNKHLTDGDIKKIKDHSYQLDFWFTIRSHELIEKMQKKLSDTYWPIVVSGILASLRDTYFGFVLYLTHLKTKKYMTKELLHTVTLIYFLDIINIHEEFFDQMFEITEILQKEFNSYFVDWILFDDNPTFFSLGYKNWVKYTHSKPIDQIVTDLTWEDVIWFKWFLKNITFYNKRYLMPQ